MDARLQFEWSNENAKLLVKTLFDAGLLGSFNEDIVNRDDATYDVSLAIKLTNKRKARKKKIGRVENFIKGGNDAKETTDRR